MTSNETQNEATSGSKPGHKIIFIYPDTTLTNFKDYFPNDVITKDLDRKLTMGRNNQDYNLDLVLMDPRISRKQAEIYFENGQKQFRIKNLTKSEICVDKKKLFENDTAPLNQDSVLRFERLATEKDTKLNFIHFRIALQIENTETETKNYSFKIVSENSYDKSTKDNNAENSEKAPTQNVANNEKDSTSQTTTSTEGQGHNDDTSAPAQKEDKTNGEDQAEKPTAPAPTETK